MLFKFIKYSICCLALLNISQLSAQDSCLVRGKVSAEKGAAVEDAIVNIGGTSTYTFTNSKGEYQLKVPLGKQIIICSRMGFESKSDTIEFTSTKTQSIHFKLKQTSNTNLNEFTVEEKSAVSAVEETPFNVVAIDAIQLQNSTKDLSQAIEMSSGVRIRRSGGQGSRTAISLNGFTGNHVKIFIDGIPMNQMGSAFQINNIPVNLAERIEIYKGVVPVELGSDALGGAINIVTRKTTNTYIDASYSYGSFNTHKSNINVGTTTKSGFTAQLNAFQNYSDNNYRVRTTLLDLETSQYSEEENWYERFHDTYHNETVIAKVGFVKKNWADKLLIGITAAQEHAEIQTANLMQIVYGGRERNATTIMPSLEYVKKNLLIENLDFTTTANYSHVENNNIDTMARQYNWEGDYRVKDTKGEGDYSLAEFTNRSIMSTSNLRYHIGEKHRFSLNNVYTQYTRHSEDDLANADDTQADAYVIDRTNAKNITGFSYTLSPSKKWNNTAFGKYYLMRVSGPMDTSTTTTARYAEHNESYGTYGYGLASNYQLFKPLQIKLSYEYSTRLPSENELFGDQLIEVGTIDLRPERSNNANLNFRFSKSLDKKKDHLLQMDLGFVYRFTHDYIRRQIEQRYGGAFYTNHGKVQTWGVDLEARYFYKNKFTVGGNITYQDIRNVEQYNVHGLELVYYQDRMPNVPYFFANADAGYKFNNFFGKNNTLSLNYNMQYMFEFFRQWESEGSANSKKTIPMQLSHDFSVTCSLKNGRYNITLEALNFTDALLYDNYSLQKPGRSFSAKFRYFFIKMK